MGEGERKKHKAEQKHTQPEWNSFKRASDAGCYVALGGQKFSLCCDYEPGRNVVSVSCCVW